MPATSTFDYATVRVVPRVEREEFMNVGVIVFCRVRRYLDARIALNRRRLAAFAPELDLDALEQHLAIIPRVAAGGRHAGPIGVLPLADRFHWLVAPRSAIVQVSPVHCGMCSDPATVLDHLVAALVHAPEAVGG